MYFEETRLLDTPIRRAAYSDRVAWLMAEMSRLAYHKFEGSVEIGEFARRLAGVTDSRKIETELTAFIDSKEQLATAAKQELVQHLAVASFRLVREFNVMDVQAFLATRVSDKMAVLAFRGTEKSVADIKTDLKAGTTEVDGSLVHEGFYKALSFVRGDIKKEVNALVDEGYSIFVTGHSLGGALALLATKYIVPDSPGACYTFGGPRVASSNFGDDVKTPIYRLVNAADIVPRLPPAYLSHILIALLEVVHIPVVGDWLVKLLERVIGYRHHGDMRYLTACRGDYTDLRLISNPTIIDRAVRFVKRVLGQWSAPLSDHGIENYCKKLSAHAKARCLPDREPEEILKWSPGPSEKR